MAYAAFADDFDREVDAELIDLLTQREDVLARFPGLNAIQDEIDSLLCNTCDPSTRLDIVCMLLAEKLDELQDAIQDLEGENRRFS